MAKTATPLSNGVVALEPSSIAIAVGAGSVVSPAVTHDGAKWLATWTSPAGQQLRTNANNGNPTGPSSVVSVNGVGGGVFGGALAAPIVAWSEDAGGETDLEGRTVALGTPFTIATQTPNQTDPAQAFGSNRWMVAWVDDRFDDSCHAWADGRSAPTLLVATDPTVGLAAEHVHALERWARCLSASG